MDGWWGCGATWNSFGSGSWISSSVCFLHVHPLIPTNPIPTKCRVHNINPRDSFDKFSMRHDIDMLLLELWRDAACKDAVRAVAAKDEGGWLLHCNHEPNGAAALLSNNQPADPNRPTSQPANQPTSQPANQLTTNQPTNPTRCVLRVPQRRPERPHVPLQGERGEGVTNEIMGSGALVLHDMRCSLIAPHSSCPNTLVNASTPNDTTPPNRTPWSAWRTSRCWRTTRRTRRCVI